MPNFFNNRCKVSRSFFERTRIGFFHRCGVFAKAANDQRASLRGQFNLTHPPVVRALLARNQAFFHQPINRHANGTGGKPDLRADGIDREGSFVEEGFEDAEIRVAQLCLLDALRPRGGTELERLS